jgi:hypothetical protein
MDRLIIERKLDSLQRYLARVRDKTPADVATLESDLDLQDVLVLNLSRAVQICVDIAVHIPSANAGNPHRIPWARRLTCSPRSNCWSPRWPSD